MNRYHIELDKLKAKEEAQVISKFQFYPSPSAANFSVALAHCFFSFSPKPLREREREMLRTILRGATATGTRFSPWRLTATATATANYSSSKDTKSTVKKAKKSNKSKGEATAAGDDEVYSGADADLFDDKGRARRLQADESDPSLDVGPNGRPLFTSTPTLAQLTSMDSCSYFKFK